MKETLIEDGKELVVGCSCGSEVLVTTELKVEGNPSELQLVIYERHYTTSLKHRIQMAWQALWRGNYYKDHMVLDQEGMTKLKNFLEELTK